jgi:hypothetical protein
MRRGGIYGKDDDGSGNGQWQILETPGGDIR